MSSTLERLCAFCEKPLPRGSHGNRKYHEECAVQVLNAAKQQGKDGHPEQQKEYEKDSRKRHPEPMHTASRRWKQRHPDYNRTYYQEHKKK